MRIKLAIAALAAAGAVLLIAAPSASATPLGAIGSSATEKADNGLVEKVGRRWYRRYGYYPRARLRYRPNYYSYYAPYYYRPYYYPSYAYYYPYYGPSYYGPYYGRRFYGGFYGPRFGVRIGY